MSKAAPAALRAIATLARISDQGLQKAAQQAYNDHLDERTEQITAWMNKTLQRDFGIEATASVNSDYRQFYAPHRAVTAEVDGLTINWVEAYKDEPRSLGIITDHCQCGRPAFYRIRNITDIGRHLYNREAPWYRPYVCYVCKGEDD